VDARETTARFPGTSSRCSLQSLVPFLVLHRNRHRPAQFGRTSSARGRATRKLQYRFLFAGLRCQAPWPFLLALVAPALLTAMPQQAELRIHRKICSNNNGDPICLLVALDSVGPWGSPARAAGWLFSAPVSPRVVLARSGQL